MPLQNRVTPFGEIVATPERGFWTGNRGILHDRAGRTLGPRRWTGKAWIICTCDFRGIRREVMAGGWTELFFLDEATALAAGHRPCFRCRREAAEAFRAAWAVGQGMSVPSAPEMDAVLHRERLEGRHKRIHDLGERAEMLPDGAMIAAGGTAWLVAEGRAFRWSPAGYEVSEGLPPVGGLLTPPSTLAALRAGYRPQMHPSLGLVSQARRQSASR